MFGRKSFKNVLESDSNSEPILDSNPPKKLNDELKTVEIISNPTESTHYDSELLESSPNRATSLIQEILKIDDNTIKPIFDYSKDQIIYPILSTIGESPNNTMFLDDLVADGVLDKQIYEKLIVCPSHPTSISSSVRVFCPKCNSMEIGKLDLFEHKKCGHIMEDKDSNSGTFPSICPSCDKEIKNVELEIKVLAMWYKCENCKEKFDDITLKIHCRKHNHDFEPNSGKLNVLYSYKLRTLHVSKTSDTTQIKKEVIKLLNGFNFSTKQNVLVKGKSQNMHEIPIYVSIPSVQGSLLIFVKNQFEGIQESDMNSILVTMLDIEPTRTLFITSSKILDGVENLAKQYNISVISDPDFSKILLDVEAFVSSWKEDKGVHK